MHSLSGCSKGRLHHGENIRRFYPESLGYYFSGDSELVYDSGALTQVSEPGSRAREPTAAGLKLRRLDGVKVLSAERRMPYALFSNDAKLSKTYPTEADVWKHARKSGLVVDVISDDEVPTPRPVLDNDYEIRPCRPDPQEDPAKNQADADREEEQDFQFSS
jgi:hypothetical protein